MSNLQSTMNIETDMSLPLRSLNCDQVVFLLLAIGCRQVDLHLRAKNITGEDLCFVDGVDDLLDLELGLPLIQSRKLFQRVSAWKTAGVEPSLFHALPDFTALLHKTHEDIGDVVSEIDDNDSEDERVIFVDNKNNHDNTPKAAQSKNKRKIAEAPATTTTGKKAKTTKADKVTKPAKPIKAVKAVAEKPRPSTVMKVQKFSVTGRSRPSNNNTFHRMQREADKVLNPHEVYTVTKHIECIRSTNQSSQLDEYATKKNCITLITNYMTDLNYRNNLKTVLYALDSLVRLITWNRDEAHPQLANYLMRFHSIYGWEQLLDLLVQHYASSDFVLKAGQLLRWIYRAAHYQQVFLKKKASELCVLILSHHCHSDEAEVSKKHKHHAATSQPILKLMLKVMLPLASEKTTRHCFSNPDFILSILNLISQYQPKLSHNSDEVILPMLEELTSLLLLVVSNGVDDDILQTFLDHQGFLTLLSLVEDSLSHELLLENTMGILFNLSTTDKCVESCLSYGVVDRIVDIADQHVFANNIFEYTCRLLTNIFAATDVLLEFMDPKADVSEIKGVTSLCVGKREVKDLLRILSQGCHVYAKDGAVLAQVLSSLNNMTIDEDIQAIFIEEQQGIPLLQQLLSQYLLEAVNSDHVESTANHKQVFEVLCKLFLNISAIKKYQHFFFATARVNELPVYEQLLQVLSLGYHSSSNLVQAVVSISLNLLLDKASDATLNTCYPFIDAIFAAFSPHLVQDELVSDTLALLLQLLTAKVVVADKPSTTTKMSLQRKCTILWDILRKYGDEEQTFEDCLAIMNQLLEHAVNNNNRGLPLSSTDVNLYQIPFISKLGGFNLLHERIKSVISSRTCMEEVFACLRMLLQAPENKVQVGMSKHGMDIFAKVWQRYKNQLSVVEEVAGAAKELVAGSVENQEQWLESTTHCDLLLDALERFMPQENVVDCVLRAFTTLSKRVDLFEENIVVSTPFCSLLIRTLLQYAPPNNSTSATIVVLRVNRLLHQLCALPVMNERFRELSSHLVAGRTVETTGLGLLLKLTKSYVGSRTGTDVTVLLSLLETLQLFAMDADSSVALGREGLCEVCVEILDQYSEDAQVLDMVLQVVYNTIQDQVNQRQFLRCKLHEKLLLLRRQLRAEEVQIKEQINEILPFLQSQRQ